MELTLSDRIRAAYSEEKAGRLESAEQQYRALLAEMPTQPDVLYLLSALILPADAHEAMVLATRALEFSAGAGGIGVSEAALQDHLLTCLRATGGVPRELEYLQRALQSDPKSVHRHVQLADVQQSVGRLNDALATLNRCWRDHPDDAGVRLRLGMVLLLTGKIESAIPHLEAVVRQWPSNLDAWVNLGAAYEKTSNVDAAARAFSQALQIDPNDPRARFGLNEIHIKVVPRWHFGMMNDRSRNEAYDMAIDQAIKSVRADVVAPLVLDIGAGSGLLSMMAARSGAAQVVACEMVESIAKKSEEIVAHNGYGSKVAIFNAKSTSLSVGKELPRRADVLVTEIFDAGLLGENVLPVLAHARAHLLTENARIVPAAAQVWMMPVESVEIFEDHYVRKQNACGFDLDPFNEFSTLRYVQIPIKQFKYEALCEPVPVLDFDFSRDVDSRDVTLDIRPTRDGVVHAWVFWFTLFLDRDTRYDSGPFNRRTHWRQAVQLEPSLPALTKNRSVRVRVNQTQNNIRFFI